MRVTPEGITTSLFHLLQPLKALSPIEVIPLGRLKSVNAQPEKALSPIEVSVSGSEIVARALQPLKVPSAISVIELGMVISFNAQQESKALYPIEVMLFGRFILSNLVQL